ncbi:MAG: SDR family NAD(P)-dependent oxidoreductase [Cyanobacteria bacterium]|jgi:NAD(P)-dependent dehydrogenase (short-subunit alcohol dehydrogenase family)|nr:SDR family NAD(P)-dependent oxidoreductase [Cyanobacteria bacterium GSL.Bin21]
MTAPTQNALEGKVCIITGASSGIGKSCAELFLKQKAKIVVVDINQERLDNTVKELEEISQSQDILSLALSVREEAQMSEMAEKTLERFGQIDILVACAGILRLGGTLKPLADTPVNEWDAIIDTNLTGTFLSNRAVLGAMIEQRQGDIVNVSSSSGRQGRAFDAPYCASKFGIIGLSESLAEEVSSYGVRVQTILPDSVDTPFWEQNGSSGIKAPVTIPPERVAQLILHLVTLPRDTFMYNTFIAPFKTRKRKRK